MTVVRSGGRGGVAAETPEEPARRESGDRGGAPNPPPPGEAQTYRVSLPKRLLQLRCLVGGVPGRVFKLEQPPGSLCAPPFVGNNRDPGGGELTLPQVPQV